jgi:hypothetical protein
MDDIHIGFGIPIVSSQKLCQVLEYLSSKNKNFEYSFEIIGYERYQIKYKSIINKVIIITI